LSAWWERHKKADAKREAEEAEERRRAEIKKAALQKLTKEERDLLRVRE